MLFNQIFFIKGQQALTAWRSFGEMKVVVKGDSTDHLLELFKESRDKVVHFFLPILTSGLQKYQPHNSKY